MACKAAGRLIVSMATRLSAVVAIGLVGTQSLAASAPDYPTKPVTFFSMGAPGSGFDTTTRQLSACLWTTCFSGVATVYPRGEGGIGQVET